MWQTERFCSSQAYISRVHGLVNDSASTSRTPSRSVVAVERLDPVARLIAGRGVARAISRPARRPDAAHTADEWRAAADDAPARSACAGERRQSAPASGGAIGVVKRAASPRIARISASNIAAPSPMKSVGRAAQPLEQQRLGGATVGGSISLPVLVAARRTPRLARRRPRSATSRLSRLARRPRDASASNAETPISGFPAANASPCIVAMPMRSPVNDPGPVATANTSIVVERDAFVLEQRHQIAWQPLGLRRATRRRPPRAARGRRAAARSSPLASWCRGRGSASGWKIIATTKTRRSRRRGIPFGMSCSSCTSWFSAMSSPATSVTPAMRQYLDAKRQHRDAIVFFRMGDFYEMFYEDALVAARALDLTLTSRSKDAGGNGIPMCGVPFHAVDGYLAKLVKQGVSRRHLRAGRGSRRRPRGSSSARSCASSRPAR